MYTNPTVQAGLAARRDDRDRALERAAQSRRVLKSRRDAILRETAALLLKGEDPDRTVLPKLYRALSAERIVDASLGFVVTDQESTTMKLGFVQGLPEDVVQRCLTLDFGQAICGTVAQTRLPIHATNIQKSLDPLSELVRSAGMTAYACQPLVVGEKFFGTLSFASRTRRAFDVEDLLFFRDIARHVAVARSRVLPGRA